MKLAPLTASEIALLLGVFQRHPEVKTVKLFGSRAKGMHATNSDIDLALWGDLNELQTESIASELDELPLPYRFDVLAFSKIEFAPLREHIERVGIVLYPEMPLAE